VKTNSLNTQFQRREKESENASRRENTLQLLRGSWLSWLGLLWEKVVVNVWKDTTLGDGNVAKKLVQLLVVSDGELQMSWDDTGLAVVTSSVTGQFENFGSEVLEDGGKVDWSTSTNTLSVVALSQETMDTTDWESETGLSRAGLGLLARAGLSTGRFSSSHFERLRDLGFEKG
jgi:hypothetical protein